MKLSHPVKPPHGGKSVLIIRIVFLVLSIGILLAMAIVLYFGIRRANSRIESTAPQPVIGIDEANFQKALERSNK